MASGPGTFITFEGGEGAGKTTQIALLKDYLEGSGYKVLTTREPGGTKAAEAVRDILVQRHGGDWNAEEETLLLAAARAHHLRTLIVPALEEGKIVICDRFSDSTRVYQGSGLGLDRQRIEEINRIATKGLEPDITFIMDIDPETGLGRSEKRFSDAGSGSKEKTEDRYERLDYSFHKKIRQGFLNLAKVYPERCVVIDAHNPVSTIAEKIKSETIKRLT